MCLSGDPPVVLGHGEAGLGGELLLDHVHKVLVVGDDLWVGGWTWVYREENG